MRKLSHPRVPELPAATAEPHLLWLGCQLLGFKLGTQWVTPEKTGDTSAPGSRQPGFHHGVLPVSQVGGGGPQEPWEMVGQRHALAKVLLHLTAIHHSSRGRLTFPERRVPGNPAAEGSRESKVLDTQNPSTEQAWLDSGCPRNLSPETPGPRKSPLPPPPDFP